MNPVVDVTLRDKALHVVLGAEPANVMSGHVVDGLTEAVEVLESGAAKAAVISSSVPGFFAAGADIKTMARLSDEEFAEYRDTVRDRLDRLASCGVPTIAAIDGRALGGGLELALACTMRFAGSEASVGLPEVRLGLVPGAGGTQRLPRLIGRGHALEIMLTGRTVRAAEALQVGLVDRLVEDDVEEAARELAASFAGYSAPALRAIIDCVEHAHGPLAEGLNYESQTIADLMTEGEAREGIAAFVAKRPPAFA